MTVLSRSPVPQFPVTTLGSESDSQYDGNAKPKPHTGPHMITLYDKSSGEPLDGVTLEPYNYIRENIGLSAVKEKIVQLLYFSRR